MRVLFLTSWYPTPELPYGGVFVREHARAVEAAGGEVVVVHVPMDVYKRRGLWDLATETDDAIAAGIPTIRLVSRQVHFPRRIPASRRLGYWASYGLHVMSVAATIRRLRRDGFRPELIHAHVFGAAAVAISLRPILRLPVVATEHSTLFPRRELDRGMLKRARFAFTRADRVLPVSKSLKEAIEAYGIRARFEVVPNALDVELFHPASVEAGDAGNDPDVRRMLFVGRLERSEHKGFPTLVAALAMLDGAVPKWHLDVVGDGESRAECEAAVERAGLASRVTFHGNQPKTVVADLMRAATVFVLPSRFETQGVVLLEAMATGLPIVSTTAGAIPEVVSPSDGILVEPQRPEQLAQALERVLSGSFPFDRQDIAERARSRYSLESVGGRLVELYRQVLREHGKAAD